MGGLPIGTTVHAHSWNWSRRRFPLKGVAPAIGAYTGGLKWDCSERSRWRGWVSDCLPCGRALRLHNKYKRRPRMRDGAIRTRTPLRTLAHPRRPLISSSASGARSRRTIHMQRPGRSALSRTITPATCRRARAGTRTANKRCGASHAAPLMLNSASGLSRYPNQHPTPWRRMSVVSCLTKPWFCSVAWPYHNAVGSRRRDRGKPWGLSPQEANLLARSWLARRRGPGLGFDLRDAEPPQTRLGVRPRWWR